MKIRYIQGDLLASNESVIAHGCNAQGVMASGIAKSIRDLYPQAYEDYRARQETNGLILGSVIQSIMPERVVLNCITQNSYGRDSSIRYVSYDAIVEVIEEINTLGYVRVAFPMIGAGLANGNWQIISAIIQEASDFDPIVYYL